ncbi:hypothetical protein QTH97_32725 [Variovorax sp. J22R24]|uniref:hypothetical protein n=1 Tax=Variovorax gracilis TaxID=3053502 RepID=UPI00257823F2|nr:hypothetical protein [Variovorax sp. J22R24]MDM0109722.1 hypothetical protein [Variovorax sp. J22R24]
MLTMMHGHQAPTESSLKKWSASGEFTACVAPESEVGELAPTPSSFAGEAMLRPRRGGRPGLKLDTRRAINRVYELWPHLADTSAQAVLDLAVARAADSLESRLARLFASAPSSASPTAAEPPAGAEPPTAILEELLRQVTSLRQEMTEVKREVAQFSAMRNNLITKLDDAVARAQEAIATGTGRAGSGSDPLVEARRDRDMGVVKSMLSEILESVQKVP